MVPFESLCMVSYSPSIVTMAVSLAISGILSVKEWRDLENQIRGRSRSLKWRRSIDHIYDFLMVLHCKSLSCTVFELFDVD